MQACGQQGQLQRCIHRWWHPDPDTCSRSSSRDTVSRLSVSTTHFPCASESSHVGFTPRSKTHRVVPSERSTRPSLTSSRKAQKSAHDDKSRRSAVSSAKSSDEYVHTVHSRSSASPAVLLRDAGSGGVAVGSSEDAPRGLLAEFGGGSGGCPPARRVGVAPRMPACAGGGAPALSLRHWRTSPGLHDAAPPVPAGIALCLEPPGRKMGCALRINFGNRNAGKQNKILFCFCATTCKC